MSWLRHWPYILGLLYLISPIDLFPERFLGPRIGLVDDLLLLAFLYFTYMRKGSSARTRTYQRTSGGTSDGGAYRPGGYGADGGGNGGSRREGTGGTRSTSRDPYAILGVNHGASLEEIKHAFRVQAARYHPDKVTHLGEEFQELAKKKFQDVQWAHDELIKRGS